MKRCAKCGETKELSEFSKNKSRYDGVNGYCKSCMRSVFKELQNKPKTTPEFKTCPTCNQNKLASEYNTYKKTSDGLYFQCKSCTNEARKRTNSAPKIKVDYKKCSLCKKVKSASDFYKSVKTRDGLDCSCKECLWLKEKSNLETNLNFRLRKDIRVRLNGVIKKGKAGSAVSDLGCTVGELIEHLESKFEEGMTWSNWSQHGWHIDRIVPLSSFDLTNRELFLKACHYTNLQPL